MTGLLGLFGPRRRVRARIGVVRARRDVAAASVAALGRVVRRGTARSPLAARLAFGGAGEHADRDLGARALVALGGASLGARLAPDGRAVLGAVAGVWVMAKVVRVLEARARRAADARVTHELPFALERIGTALRSGHPIDGAVRMVAPGTRGALGEALRDAARISALGGSRGDLLRRLEAAPAEALRRTARALGRSDRLGVPVADTVETLAADLRARARAAAEADARTAPVRMLFPLAFCFLPAFVLLTIAPIAIEALRSLGGV